MDSAEGGKTHRSARRARFGARATIASTKKVIAELHHSPGLVGSIVEKGFSPLPSSASGGSNRPTLSAPQPSALPFPVARHRSHGPHWAPANNMGVNVDEDDMEEDKDDTDYDPIASLASPIRKKEKKGLDFSRWREFISEDGSVKPQPNKEGRQVAAKGRDGLNISTKDLKREALSSSDAKLIEKEANANGPGASSSFTEVLSSVDQATSENMETEVMRPNMSSDVIRDECDTNAKEKPVMDDISMLEDDFHRPPSLMDEIDAENLIQLKQMSAEEIAEAQSEIMEKMNPSIIEMLRKRGREKVENKKGIEGKKPKESKSTGIRQSVQGGKSGKQALALDDWLLSGELHCSSWKEWSERVEKVREMRFSLDGNVLESNYGQEQLNGDKSNAYTIENVAERDFLRTEGDPAAVGYTINEAVELVRSMIPGQRAIALQLLASIFNKAVHGLQHFNRGHSMEEAGLGGKLVDWQAIWAFSLGPEPQMALALRIALDDNHDSVVLASIKAIQSILCCDINENYFNIKENLSSTLKDNYTAPIFRSRPEIDGGFLHGGYWKYSTKPSNIIPQTDHEDDDDDGTENEDKQTIQDDLIVAGQDIAAGFVRMGILPRICYLLEMGPPPALEESLISIMIAIARHSPTSTEAVMICPRLVDTVINSLTKQGLAERYQCQIKAVRLLKVLSQSNKSICSDFVKRGTFQLAMQQLYKISFDFLKEKNPFTINQWIKSGKEHCKLTSTLMVEQLRLWKVFIHHGFCISCFTDFFPTLCLWLSPPSFEKLIENNVLTEFTSITTEAYLVLEALSQKLPSLYSAEQLNKQDSDSFSVDSWPWSIAVSMVKLAMNWLSVRSIPYVSSLIGCHDTRMNQTEVSLADSMLWLTSAVLHMLCGILERVGLDMNESSTPLPWLPYFVPQVGLEIIRNGFLGFSYAINSELNGFPPESGSLAQGLCFLRQQNNFHATLSSASCLRALVRIAFLVDSAVKRAKLANSVQIPEDCSSNIDEKILEEGITKWAQNDFSHILSMVMSIISVEWPVVLSSEMFGRGGPAPGGGFGWGSSGGGFWSLNMLIAQADAQLMLDLLNIFPVVPKKVLVHGHAVTPVMDSSAYSLSFGTINSLLAVCLVAGPGSRVSLEKAWGFLLQAPVLEHLNSCIGSFLRIKGLEFIDLQLSDQDYIFFSKILNFHYKEKWSSIKKSSRAGEKDQISGLLNKSHPLETIHEEIEPSEATYTHPKENYMLVEWARQRLPLPIHWLLSAICAIGDSRATKKCSPTDAFNVTKGGLLFLLGLEAMSSGMDGTKTNLISSIPLAWKLHSLSVALYVNMDVIEEEKSRAIFETLQQLYGQQLDDQPKCGDTEDYFDKIQEIQASSAIISKTEASSRKECLRFQEVIHSSYTTFVENLAEQFGAISYGSMIYGRQVALYLHRTTEATIRHAAWSALSNAHALELLPPAGNCIGGAKGYLEPLEDNEGILEAYAKSWTSGVLDRAADRGSISFTLAVHHLSGFLFSTRASEKPSLKSRLAKSLLRTYSQKGNKESMLVTLIRHSLVSSEEPCFATELARRLEVLKEACQGNSSRSLEIEKLKSSVYNL